VSIRHHAVSFSCAVDFADGFVVICTRYSSAPEHQRITETIYEILTGEKFVSDACTLACLALFAYVDCKTDCLIVGFSTVCR